MKIQAIYKTLKFLDLNNSLSPILLLCFLSYRKKYVSFFLKLTLPVVFFLLTLLFVWDFRFLLFIGSFLSSLKRAYIQIKNINNNENIY